MFGCQVLGLFMSEEGQPGLQEMDDICEKGSESRNVLTCPDKALLMPQPALCCVTGILCCVILREFCYMLNLLVRMGVNVQKSYSVCFWSVFTELSK